MKILIQKTLAVLALVCVVSSTTGVQYLNLYDFFEIEQAQAAVNLVCTDSIGPGASATTGETFSYDVAINNTGTPESGFQPFVDVIQAPEVVFGSATFSLGGLAASPVATVVPLSGEIQHPVTQELLTGLTPGFTLYTFILPLTSIAPGQGPFTVSIDNTIDSSAPLFVPLTDAVQTRCGFGLGEDALRNPATDPVITSAFETNEVTPNVFSVAKSVVLPENEVSTGPNHPVVYNLSSHVGDGALLPITNLTLSDVLPTGFVIDPAISPILVNDTSVNGCTITYTPLIGAAVSDGGACDPTVLGVGPFGPGGTIEVDFNSMPGGMGDPSLEITGYFTEFDAFGADILNPATGLPPVAQENSVNGSGDYDGIALLANDGPVVVDVKNFNIVKSVDFATGGNLFDPGYQPGDTVEFSLDIDISDYFSMDTLAIEDIMSDGFSYEPGSLEITISEAGSTDGPFSSIVDFTEIITDETNVPVGLSGGPSFDFSDCDGLGNPCQLVVSEDLTDDNDGGEIDDGETQLILDISQIMIDQDTAAQGNGEIVGNVANAASMSISYQAVIDENYVDGDGLFDNSVDSTDPLSNDVEVHGVITSGASPGGLVSEDSETSINIVEATYNKELIAINGAPVVGTPQVKAGDDITFAFLINVPSGDAEDITLTDFLPQPVFDVDSLPAISFDNASNDDGSGGFDTRYELGGVNGVPATNVVGFGTQTSGIPSPYVLPDLVTTNSTENSFSVSFPDNSSFDEDPSNGVIIEFLATVAVEDKPFADGLEIVNFAELTVGNSSSNAALNSAAVASITLQAPDLDIKKSVVSSDGLNAVIDPALPGYLTFDAPESSPSITAGFPISSDGDLDSTELDSDIVDVDAGDIVTFATIIENISGVSAFDVRVTDALPTGFDVPTGGANIQVYDGEGNNIAVQTEGGLFGDIPAGGATDGGGDLELSFLSGISPLDGDSEAGGINEGANIVIITYDLEISQDIEPIEEVENQAGVVNFASNPAGANYADGQEEFYQDSASVKAQTIRYYKNVNSSDQAFTVDPNAVVGEVVTYEVAVELPEGTTPNLVMRDQIPGRLGVYTTSGVTIDTTGATCSVMTEAFGGTVPAGTINSPADPVGSSGADLNVSFGGPIVVTNDNNPDNNIFCILYDVVVLDNGGNQNGTNRQNRVDFDFGTAANSTDSFSHDPTNPDYGSADKRARIDIVDANLDIEKNVYLPGTSTPPTNIDAGDRLEYSITVEHAADSGAPAFDLELTDDLSGLPLTVVDDFSTDGLDNTGSGSDDELLDGVAALFWDGTEFTFNNTTTGNALFDELDLGESFEIRFLVDVGDLVAPSELISNLAEIESDSIPGTNADANVAAEERTETDSDTVDFSIDATSTMKSILSTDDLNTGSAENVVANEDLSIGEQITYRIEIDVPEGQILNGLVTDVLPDFLRADSASVSSPGSGVFVNPVIALTDTKFGDGLNDTVTYAFDSYTLAATSGNSNTTIQIDVVATLIDEPPAPNVGNVDTDILSNQASLTFDTLVTPQDSNAVLVDVVEPDVELVKSVSACGSPCDDGSELTYTIVATNNGTAAAYDLEITDDLAGLPLTVVDDFSTDGLDNTGSGSDDEPSDGVAALFWDGTEFTFNNATTGVALFNQLDPGASITLEFDVSVTDDAEFNETITNTSNIAYDSSLGVNTDERDYTDTSSVDFQVDTISQIQKVVTSSNNANTGAGEHVLTNTDLTIGELVTYTITIPDIPELTANNFVVTEQLPEIFRYESSSVNLNGISNSILVETTDDLAPADGIVDSVEFDFGTITNPSGNGIQSIVITIDATVIDDVLNQDANVDVNNVSLSFDELVGADLTDTANTDIVEPLIDVNKTVVECTTPCDAGSTITYEVEITNNGTAPAYDIEITDDPSSLPITVVDTFSSDGLDNTGSGADDELLDGVAALFWDGTEFTFNSTTAANTSFDRLDPTDSITLRYSATIDGGVVGGTTITNQADVAYDSSAGVNPDERDYTASGTSSVDVSLITDSVTKEIVSSTNPNTSASQFDNSLDDVSIGEQVTYTITIPNIPETTFTDVVGVDVLPEFLRFDSAVVNTNGITTDFVAETLQDLAPVDGFDDTITFDFGDIDNPLGNGLDNIVITVNATVINNPANVNSTVLTNNFTFDYDQNTGAAFTASESSEIVEPDLDIQKSVSVCDSPCFAGSQVTYTLDIVNNGNGPAHDLEITDDLSAIGVMALGNFSSDGLDNTGSGSDDELLDGDAASFYTLATEAFVFNTSTTGNAQFDTLLPGDSIQIEFVVEVEQGTAPRDVITNEVDIEYDSFPGVNVDEKSYTGNDTVDLTLDDYDPIIQKQITATSLADTGSAQLNPANPDLAIGEQVTYTITVPDVPTTSLTDFVIIDTLPSGFRFDSAVVNTNGISTGFVAATTQDVSPVDGLNETVTLDFGNISNTPANGVQDISIDILATVLDNSLNFNSTPYANLVTLDFDENDDPPANAFAIADVVEPSLSLTKVASACPANCDAGSEVTYTVQLENTGSAAAYDIEIEDDMSTIPMVPVGNFSSDGLDNTGSGADDEILDGDLASFYTLATETLLFNALTTGNTQFDQLDPGQTITIEFSGEVEADVIIGQDIVNTISADSYSIDSLNPEARLYPSLSNETVTASNLISFDKQVVSTSLIETGTTAYNIANPDVAIGEEVTYEITIQNITEGNLTNVSVVDTLPEVFEYVSSSITLNGITTDFVAEVVQDIAPADGVDDTVTFDFGTVTNPSGNGVQDLVIEVTALVLDNAGNTAGPDYENSATLFADQLLGGQTTATANVDIVEPAIDIQKSVNPLTGGPVDQFDYTIEVTNSGFGPAYNVNILDPLQANLDIVDTFSSDGLDNDGLNGIDDLAETDGVNAFWDGSSFDWDIPVILAGDTVLISFLSTVSGVVPNQVLTNTSSLTYDSSTGPTTRSGSDNDDADLSIPFVGQLVKDTSLVDTNITVGQVVPYEVTLYVPANTVLNSLTGSDVFPTGMAFLPDSLSITSNATTIGGLTSGAELLVENLPPALVQTPTSDVIPTGVQQEVSFDFGQVENTSATQTAEIYIAYDALVMNTSDNASGDIKVNNFEVDYDGVVVGPVNAPPLTIVEPNLVGSKSVVANNGDTITYQVEIYNDSPTTAYNPLITDQLVLPETTFLTGSPIEISGPGNLTAIEIDSQNLQFNFPSIDSTYNVGNPIVIQYQVEIDTSLASGTVFNNDLNYEWTTDQTPTIGDLIPGTDVDTYRSGDNALPGGAENDLLGSVFTPATVTRPDLSTSLKTVTDLNGDSVVPGDILEFIITLTNSGNEDATGIILTDEVDADFNTLDVISFPGGGNDASLSDPNGANGEGTVVIENISIPQGTSVQIVYRLTVDTGIGIGVSLDNTFETTSSLEGGSPATGSTNNITESPILEVQKVASNIQPNAGDTVTYRISIENTGTAASTNVVLIDSLQANLDYVQGQSQLDIGAVSTVLTDAVDLDGFDFGVTSADTLTLSIPALLVGEVAELSYDTIPLSASRGTTIVNTVQVIDDQGNDVQASANITIPRPSGGGSSSTNGGGCNPFAGNCGEPESEVEELVVDPPVDSEEPEISDEDPVDEPEEFVDSEDVIDVDQVVDTGELGDIPEPETDLQGATFQPYSEFLISGYDYTKIYGAGLMGIFVLLFVSLFKRFKYKNE